MRTLVLLALGFGGYLLLRKPTASASTASKPTASKPKTSTPITKAPSITTATVPIVIDNTSPTLSTDESTAIANDSNDLLFGWGIVTNHKAFAQAIANKLAAAGDLRAVTINSRIANWSTFNTLLNYETDMVANPMKYTYQQLTEAALASDSPEFKTWAASFLESENQVDSASLIRSQIAAQS